MVWAEMKKYIASKMCSNSYEVKEAIAEFLAELTPSKCRNYISHLREVLTYNKICLFLKFFFHRQLTSIDTVN